MSYLKLGIEIIKTIESNGYKAYLIGGVVRDYLLSMPINDVDITTNMPIEKLKEAFEIEDNGSDYASLTIIKDDYRFEITHFRRDVKYLDHRHPIVELCDKLEDDVKRRDFTINAFAMDSNYNIIDYFNGLSDLKSKSIKSINDPMIRFDEDSLRILRALYFSSKLDFEIEENTLRAMVESRHLLCYLSNERIYDYFTKILYAKTNRGLEYIKKYHLFDYLKSFNDWLNIINPSYNINDLVLYYYHEYNDFPPVISAKDKKRCWIFKEIINSNFDNYTIYKYQEEIKEFLDVFLNLEYDIIDIKEKLNSLKIKNDKELALSPSKIATMFKGDMISIAIREVVKAILNGKIDNNEKSILIFLQGLDVLKC